MVTATAAATITYSRYQNTPSQEYGKASNPICFARIGVDLILCRHYTSQLASVSRGASRIVGHEWAVGSGSLREYN